MRSQKVAGMSIVVLLLLALSTLAVPMPLGVAGVISGTNDTNFYVSIAVYNASSNALMHNVTVSATANYQFATAIPIDHLDVVDIVVYAAGGVDQGTTGNTSSSSVTAGESVFVTIPVESENGTTTTTNPGTDDELGPIPPQQDDVQIDNQPPGHSTDGSRPTTGDDDEAEYEDSRPPIDDEQPGVLDDAGKITVTIVQLFIIILVLMDSIFVFLIFKKRKKEEEQASKQQLPKTGAAVPAPGAAETTNANQGTGQQQTQS